MIKKILVIFLMILLVMNISYAGDVEEEGGLLYGMVAFFANLYTGYAVNPLLADATLEVVPSEGYAGDEVKIIGKKFLSGVEIESLHILWDGNEIAKVPYPGGGEFGVNVKVPDVKGGGRSKITVKEVSGVSCNFKVLVPEVEPEVLPPQLEPEIEPSSKSFIKLDYYTGLSGAKIKLTGVDFPLLDASLLDVWKGKILGDEKIITILFDGEIIIKTKYKTFFEEYFTVPELDAGKYKITVANFSEVESLEFIIRNDEDPYLMVYPDSGLSGDVIVIEGNNFPFGVDGGNLQVLWDGEKFIEVSYPVENGRFKIYPIVPQVEENITQSEIIVKGYNSTLFYFDIETEAEEIPRITITPSFVFAGEKISISGKNFPMGMVTYLNVMIGNKQISKFLYTGGGTFLTHATIPGVPSGMYAIIVEGFAKTYLNVSNLNGTINVTSGDGDDGGEGEGEGYFDGGDDGGDGEGDSGDGDDGKYDVIGRELVKITATVANTIGSNQCAPYCFENCGQPDGCGGFCLMDDINIPGMCGNPEITNTYENKTNEVAEGVEGFFKWMGVFN